MGPSRIERAATGNFGPVPDWFRHTSEAQPVEGKPDLPGDLNEDEKAEVDKWLGLYERMAAISVEPLDEHDFSEKAIAVIEQFKSYYASGAYLTWLHDDRISRDLQWRLRNVDLLDKLTTPAQ